MKNITEFINEVAGTVDKATVRELTLWCENTETLWRQCEAVANSMIKKSKREEMSLEYLTKSSIVDKIVRNTFNDYNKQFGLPKMSTATRNELKKSIAQSIWDYYEDNK